MSLTIFFTSMENSFVPMILQLIYIIVHLCITYLFVTVLDMGYLGIAFAKNCSSFSLLAVFWLYVKAKIHCTGDLKFRQIWPRFNRKVFQNIGTFTKLAFSGLVITSLEEWSNEGLQLISGLLGVADQSAMSIVFSVMWITYIFPLSIGLTISALVGQAIGSGNVPKARKTMWLIVITGQVTYILISITVQLRGRALIETIMDD